MSITKVVVLKKYGRAEEAFAMEERPMPIPAADEVLIKVHYSGINFADIMARLGLYDDAPKPPSIIGYDVSGIVTSVGQDVTHLKVGDRVSALTRFGGYAAYAIAKAKATAVVPDNISMDLAPALATQACTAYYCAVDSLTLHKGEKILIQAAGGGVGSILVQLAKHYGCEVFATASASKHEFVRSLGADHIIDYNTTSFTEYIKTHSSTGIDVVFDSLGGQAFKKAYKLLRPTGKMVCYGAAENMDSVKNKLKLLSLAAGFGIFSPIPMLMESKSLIMINMLRLADHKPEVFGEIFGKTMAMAQSGIIKPHIGAVFTIDEVAKAHDFVEQRKSTGKVVLQWV